MTRINIQIKLLRVLQDGEIRPVGATKATYADTRVIAVTNQDLETKIKEGTFREDLYYRLKVLTLLSPPLRERREDIPLLATHFLRRTCKELGVEEKSFSPELMAILCQYNWHGNVRELQNTVRRMAVFCTGPVLEKTHLQTDIIETVAKPKHATVIEPYKKSKQMLIESFTHEYVDQLLKKTRGNISEAARLSGLERVSLQKILKRLQIDATPYKG